MNELIENKIGSREVAEMMEVRHTDLLRKIEGINEDFTKSKIAFSKYWTDGTYKDASGKSNKEFQITKRGCEFLANKTTGTKGNLFTDKYMDKFEQMKEIIQLPRLSKELQAIFAIDDKQQELEVKVEVLKDDIEGMRDNMPLFNVECKELQALVRKVGIKALGGYKSPAYNDSSLRCRIYQDIQQQLKREFGVTRYEAIKRCQLEKATLIVNNYTIPFILQEVVTEENNQMKFGEVV